MRKLVLLISALMLVALGCEKKEEKVPAVEPDAAPTAEEEKAEKEEGLTPDLLQAAEKETESFTDWHATYESLTKALGEETHSQGLAYYWAIMKGDACHQLHVQLTGDGQVGPQAYDAFQQDSPLYASCKEHARG